MKRARKSKHRADHSTEQLEAILIVGLCALVVIKGAGAVGAIVAGIGQMFLAVLR